MLQPFKLYEPTSATEACQLLAQHGDDARIYAGGTELVLVMKQGFMNCGHLINIKSLGLNEVTFANGVLKIGALATHRTVEYSPVVHESLPLLAEVERKVANVRVRSLGTLGGNLCFAEPHSDIGAVLMLYDTTLAVTGSKGSRSIPLSDFFIDAYTTCLEPDELMTEIHVPVLPAGAGAAYSKFAILERPSVSVAVALIPTADGKSVAEARIVVGCVDPTPRRLAAAEAKLKGVQLGGALFAVALAEAAEAAGNACDPVDDLHGTADYKRHLVRVLIRRTGETAHERNQEVTAR